MRGPARALGGPGRGGAVLSGEGSGSSPEALSLARERAAARRAGDFATADALRARLRALGYLVIDTPDGFQLAPAPPVVALAGVAELPERAGVAPTRRASVAVRVEGWPEDLARCLDSVLTYAPADVGVLALDEGNVGGAGEVLDGYARAHPERIEAFHLERPVGFAAARNALARADPAGAHLWLDTCVELTADAVTPLLAALAAPGVVAAGPFGVDVSADWREFRDAQPGAVDALNGYFVAFDRAALLAVGGVDRRARFYRNADLELSFALRAAGGTVVMTEDPRVRLHRHRGYLDSDPGVREKESRRNYDRFLARFRGREELRARPG